MDTYRTMSAEQLSTKSRTSPAICDKMTHILMLDKGSSQYWGQAKYTCTLTAKTIYMFFSYPPKINMNNCIFSSCSVVVKTLSHLECTIMVWVCQGSDYYHLHQLMRHTGESACLTCLYVALFSLCFVGKIANVFSNVSCGLCVFNHK